MKGLTPEELLNWTPPPQPTLIGKGLCHILVPESRLIVFGEAETWKSMLTIDMAFALNTGSDWLGFNTSKSSVFLLQTELPQRQLQSRIKKYITGHNFSVNGSGMWLATEAYIKLDKGWGFGQLEQELDRTHPRVLIIDPIYAVVSGKLSDEYDMRQLMDRLDMLRSKYHIAVVLVHHTRKPEHLQGERYTYGADDMFGAAEWVWWGDSVIRSDHGQRDNEIVLTFEKLRHNEDEKPKPIAVVIDRKTLSFRVKE